MTNATTSSVPVLSPRAALCAWLALGLGLAFSGVAAHAPIVFPLWLVTSVASWTIVYRRWSAARAWIDGIDLRTIVLGHAIRLPIGALFLYEMSEGRLAPLFATRAGYGDIAIGILALALAFSMRRRLVVAFTIIGLVDIALAIGTGMYLLFVARDPMFVAPFAQMPYPLIPTVIVPLVILTHLATLARSR